MAWITGKPMELSGADLAPIRELYGQSLYLQAYRITEHFGAMKEWRSTSSRLLGGRLAIQLGAPRLGRWLHLRAYRDTPTHPEAIYYHARFRLERFGPLATWKFFRQHLDWNDAPPEVRADWYGLQGFVAARLRDFDRAERLLNKAESITPERPWLCIERAATYEFADRYEDALQATRRSLELHPHFRPGIQAEAHLLQLLGREREAIDRLTQIIDHIESGIIVAHLAGIHLDLGHYSDARRYYQRYAELSPLMEEEVQKWLAARQSDTAYFCRDFLSAKEYALKADEPFYSDFAKKLEEAEANPNLQSQTNSFRLDLLEKGPQLRTLVSESRNLEVFCAYWDIRPKTIPPLESGTYDGLPDPKERKWAEENGFRGIEFTVTPDSACALLDRRIPFLMTMVEAGYTHSQIVVGYDKVRNSLWVRDVTDRRTNEAPLNTIQERYSSTGPRGLALVPIEQSVLLEDLSLEDSPLYEELHRIQMALLHFDRPTASSLLSAMRQTNPDHRITRHARLALARQDANPAALLTAINSMIDLFPEDATFLLSKIGTLRDLGRKEERFALAKQQIERGEKGDPLFGQHYAQMLLSESSQQPLGIRVLEKSIRRRPYSAGGYYILAGLCWEQQQFPESTDLYRFASCLDERDEQFAEGYFRAARTLDQLPEAMRFLQLRFNRNKGKLSSPARALFYALSEQEEMNSAFAILEQAYQPFLQGEWQPKSAVEKVEEKVEEKADDMSSASLRGDLPTPYPEDPSPTPLPPLPNIDLQEVAEVMLFTSEMRANYNDPNKGREILEKASSIALKANWHRTAARIATLYADLLTAKRHWEEVLQEEPLANDVHRNLARTIADLEGREAGISWVQNYADRFPYYHPLQQLLIDWLRLDGNQSTQLDLDEPAAAPIIRRVIQQCPEDAWAYRELALNLANHGRSDEALTVLEEARKIEPESPSYFFTLGHVYQKADRIAEAKSAYQQALERSVDNDVAIMELVNLSRGEEEREELLYLVAQEFKNQGNFGDGLLTFRDQAIGILEPDDLLKILSELNDLYPEIWQTWSTTIQQLGMVGRLEEAFELANESVTRFPLLSRLWVDLADVCHAQNEIEGQIRALRMAVQVAPGWGFATRELAEALEANGQSEDARVILEQAIGRVPLDPVNHGYLADNLWNSGDSEEAIFRLQQALKLDPGYDWAWRALGDWAERMDSPDRAIEIAKEVARTRPGDPRGWLALVRMMHKSEYHEDALEALDRAIKLYPRSVEAYDLKAERLAEMGRFEEARQTASPPIFDFDPPYVLQGRAAWVEAKAGNFESAINQMQALVDIEPNYYWGWQQLAEWHNELNHSEEYLQAADHLVEMRPESPVALAMRGEAKLQTGDREGGKRDLREAQKIAPGYSFAGMLLFDAYLQDQEYGNAQATLAMLQEHIGGSGRPYVAARYTQIASRSGDKDAAITALQEVCSLSCDSTWPITTAIGEVRNAGWSDDADRVLRESWDNEEGFHPWTLLVWLDGPEGLKASATDKITFVEKVIAAHPRFVQGHDVRAELLTRLRQYDEALQACHPEVFGDKPPLVLRGRSAWILYMRGDKPEAIARMREILITDRDYYWGWQQLASWYDTPDSHSDYLDAGENLVRLAPNEPTSYGYRGEAKLFLGDRRGAKLDFQKAFDLDPNYVFAGLHLIDEQLSEDDLSAASTTLAKLQEHADGPYVQLRGIRLAIRQKDKESAKEALHAMMTHSDTPKLLLNKATDALSEAGWSTTVDEVLSEVITKSNINPQIGSLWVDRHIAKNDWSFLEQMGDLLDRGLIGEESLLAAIEGASYPAKADRFYELMTRFDDTLRKSDSAWSKVAEGLINVRNFPLAGSWVADWKKREITHAHLLHPAAVIFRLIGRIHEGYEVCETALSHSEDSLGSDFHTWMAFEDAMEGRTESARNHWDEVDEDDLGDPLRILYTLAEALIRIQEVPPGDRSALFAESKEEVKRIIGELAPKEPNPDLCQSYRRWVARIAKDVGGISAWFWSLKQKWNPAL
jgi:cellulose synthase operon protein C